MFRVGMKVVCVDDSPPQWPSSTQLIKGNIYTIAGFDPEASDGSVYLVELQNDPPPAGSTYPVGWRPFRFRPVVSRSTEAGMSILRRALTDRRVSA